MLWDKLKFNKRVDHTSSIIRPQAYYGRLPKACGLMIELVWSTLLSFFFALNSKYADTIYKSLLFRKPKIKIKPNQRLAEQLEVYIETGIREGVIDDAQLGLCRVSIPVQREGPLRSSPTNYDATNNQYNQ